MSNFQTLDVYKTVVNPLNLVYYVFMKLSHFSAKPFTFNPKQTYVNELFWIKPSGLWLSDESEYGWKQWCTNEQWGLEGLKYETK